MRKWIVSAVIVAGLAIVGCHKDKSHDMNKKMSMDACPNCPGVQTPTADGKCPGCGAKVSAASAVDVCSHCPGVQTVTAEGKCSGCQAPLKKS